MALVPVVVQASSACVGTSTVSGSLLHGGIVGAGVFGLLEMGRACKRRRVQENESAEAVSSNQSLKTKVHCLEKQVELLTTVVNATNDQMRTSPTWSYVGPILEKVVTSKELSELTTKVDQKADREDVPILREFSDLAAKVEKKPNLDEVPTLQQFQDSLSVLNQKAGFDQVPSHTQIEVIMTQMAEIREDMKKKPDFDQVPSCAQVEESAAQLAELREDVKRKPNFDQLPSHAQVEDSAAQLAELRQDMKKKPDFDQVPTLEDVRKLSNDCMAPAFSQVQELMSVMVDKSSSGQVRIKKEKFVSESSSSKRHESAGGWDADPICVEETIGASQPKLPFASVHECIVV